MAAVRTSRPALAVMRADSSGVVIPIRRAPTRRSAGSGPPGPVRTGTRPGRVRVRLTRRGRAVLLALFLLLAAALVALLAPASRAAGPAGAAPTAVVQPGDTLWSVTERHRPGRDPFLVIEEIRRLNGLDDYTVHAGQHLELPRR